MIFMLIVAYLSTKIYNVAPANPAAGGNPHAEFCFFIDSQPRRGGMVSQLPSSAAALLPVPELPITPGSLQHKVTALL